MAEKIVEVDGKRYMKVQKGKYFNKKKSRKMKRHHPVRWILISAFCLLIVAPVGFLFGAFYVPKKTDLPDTYDKFEENLSNAVATSLSTMKDGEFRLNFDENFLSSALTYVKNKYIESTGASQFIDNIYCTIDGTQYNFYLEAHLSFFQTQVCLQTTLDKGPEIFTFKIDDVKVGRLPLANLASQILPQFVNESDFNKAIQQAGFSATLSLADRTITYPRANFKNDMANVLKIFNDDDKVTPMGSLGTMILSLYNTIKTEPSFENGIEFGLNFKKLMDEIVEKDYENKIESYDDLLDARKKFTIKCINNGLVSSKTSLEGETQGCDNLFKFLIKGYDDSCNLSDELKKAIVKEYVYPEKKESEIVASDISLYPGKLKTYDSTEEKFIDKTSICSDLVGRLNDHTYTSSYIQTDQEKLALMLVRLGQQTADTELFGTLGEDLMSDYLRSAIIPSFAFCFPIKINNEYLMPTITFDDFCCNINKGKVKVMDPEEIEKEIEYDISLIGTLDIEGIKIPFTVLNDLSYQNRSIKISPKAYCMGNIYLADIGETIMNFVTSAFSSNPNDIFSFDSTSETKGFVINFGAFKVEKERAPEVYEEINKIIAGTGVEGAAIDFYPEYVAPTDDTPGMLKLFFKNKY